MEYDVQFENIYHGKTKKYFHEVISSYYNGNFRAAIVVLYSVVISDVLYKLEELSNVYGERKAYDILETINVIRKSSPQSAEWEAKLLDQIKNANDFFDMSTHRNIEYLRSLRHLAAHPALDQDNELYLPNKATVASCISNMFEGVLTKPPLFVKKATEKIVADIANLKDKFLYDYENYKKYLESVYFSHMSIGMYKKVFKDIWKLTFCLDNEECEENRLINYRCLMIMIERNRSELLGKR